MKAKTKSHARAEKVEPNRWWLPQLDTPAGRVELVIDSPDHVQARCAGWMQSMERLISRDVEIALTRATDGTWKPEEIYRARRDREIAQTVADAVTAWVAAGGLENSDLGRRATALHGASWITWMEPRMALETRADRLSADIESGLFDLDDAGRARTIAARAAERLRQMMTEIDAMRDELRQAITPTENKAAA